MSLEQIYVADSRIAGRGVYAKVDIQQGESILNFRGSIISLEEALARPVDGCPLQIGPETYLDLIDPEVLVNHSCRPNAGLRKFVLTALTEIRGGTEITYDYSTTMDEDLWTMPCTCGAEGCRGIVTDFKFLPPDLREEYLDLGVVQDFIARQYPRVRRALC